MKRILLPALLIGVLLLNACGTSSEISTPTPGATEPSESEEAPDYTRWIAAELSNLNQAMLQFATKYPILTRVYDEEEGEVLIHKLRVTAGGSWYMISYMPAFDIYEAKTHIHNAYWLTNEGKLPDEVMARDVSTDEITQEVSQAINHLELQVSYSYSSQEADIEWITEATSPRPELTTAGQVNREAALRNLTEVYDDYREELSKIIPKLDLILSRLQISDGLRQTVSKPLEPVYEDDFSNPQSGWARYSGESRETGYEDGEYHILVKKYDWAAWVYNRNAGRFTDFVLEIDTRLVSGPEESLYGVTFRVQDTEAENYYRFLVSGDGYYLIGTKTNDVWTILQSKTKSAFIQEGYNTNHLEVVCRDSQIEVYVNGHHLNTITDDSFAEGCMGMIVDTPAPDTLVAFDNLKVYSLD